MAALNLIAAILQYTPIWVWALFALLVAIGLQATRPRRMKLRRAFVLPAVFLIWGLVSLAAKSGGAPLPILDWLVTAGAGLALARWTVRLDAMRADRANRIVHLPGTWSVLARIVSVFVAKYALAVAMNIRADIAPQLAYWDLAVSGLAAGYFSGWAARFLAAYRIAPGLTHVNDKIANFASVTANAGSHQ